MRLGFALALLSASLIACQLVFMQILAIVQWHHFAYMVISIAMLGFGAAGTAISIFRAWLLRNKDFLLPVFSIATGIAMELALRLNNSTHLSFDLYHLFIDRTQFWILALNLLIYFLPFFFAALVIGLIFSAWVAKIGKLYFANLLGSGAGGLLALVILSMFLPWQALSLCSISAMLSGLLMIRKEKPLRIIMLTGTVLLFSCFILAKPVGVKPSQYKSLSKTLNMPETSVIFQKPGIYGLNQLVSSPFLRYAPGVSLAYQGKIPVKKAIYTNGEFAGVISENWNRESHPAGFTTFALPFELASLDTVLVLHAGTGYFVAHALRKGSQHVDATESNNTLVSLMQSALSSGSGSLYNHANVVLHNIEARTFIESGKKKYGLIILPVLDAFGGSTGLHAMQENYTLTVEGFERAWKRLRPDGIMTVSSWLDYPVRTPLKIASTVAEMLKRNEIDDPGAHIIMIKSWGTITFIISRNPVDEEKVAITRAFCDSLFFDPVFMPGLKEVERNRYNAFGDPALFEMLDKIFAGSMNYHDYSFHIQPASDNKPYFNHFLRLRSLRELSGLYQQQALPFLELGYLIVLITFIQVIILAIILILLPLFFRKAGKGSRMPVLIYFGAIGLGYMFIEIILIQRFILYFGTPVIAAAAVISILLISSGTGSYVSGYMKPAARNVMGVMAIIITCSLLMIIGFNTLLLATIGCHILVKTLVAVVIIGVPGFFMGIPFPLGLRKTSIGNESLVPWAWGINGCMSVIASPLAILIAVEAGFMWVMLSAVAVYLMALVVAGKTWNYQAYKPKWH